MRLQILSDLHTEMFPDVGAVERICTSFLADADVLCLAGDIGVLGPRVYWERVRVALRIFCRHYRRVLYVCGNHELYSSDFDVVAARLRDFEEEHRGRLVAVEGPEPRLLRVGGKRIFGCTLWFPHRADNHVWWPGMSDSVLVDRSRPGHALHLMEKRGALAVKSLTRRVREGDIVVTHHVPHRAGISPGYQGYELNRFFVHEGAERVIMERRPAVWICGHTHSSLDRRVGPGVEVHQDLFWMETGGTRILSNPFGYLGPKEDRRNPRFDPRMIIDV